VTLGDPQGSRSGGGRTRAKLRAKRQLRAMLTALAILVTCRALVIGFYTVTSRSMFPTLLAGDWIVVNKMRYGAQVPFLAWHLPGYATPAAGDVAVFVSRQLVGGGPSTPVLIKRIVGVAGDTLLMRGGVVRRNDLPNASDSAARPLSSLPYTERTLWWIRDQGVRGTRFGSPPKNPTVTDWGPIVVPRDSVFMMGDNVNGSEDSRHFGFIGARSIIGAASAIYLTVAKEQGHRSIRFDRIGGIGR